MIKPLTIGAALSDKQLLGAALGPTESWIAWFATLKAAFAEVLNEQELVHYATVAGDRPLPTKRVRELWCIIGRRGGKTRAASAICVYLAIFIDHSGYLSPGETGYVLCLSLSKDQAELTHGYARAFLEESPILKQEIVRVTQTEIELRNRITIATHTNSFRTVRGRTIVACVFDESAYWRDEASANPDLETYRAVLPALLTTRGMLVGISSPYRRAGLLHQKHRDHFGNASNEDVLVVAGGSTVFNPTLDLKAIEAARRDDPEAARSEYDGEFRSDLSALLDDAVIDAAVDHTRPLELPPDSKTKYCAFADASAGRNDAFTLAIGHKEGDRFIADVVRGTKPPFDANGVAKEYAQLARTYRCFTVTADAFAGAWVEQAFQKAGVRYRKSALTKSKLYLEGVAPFNRGAVSIPDQPQLLRELRLLERRVQRSGADVVDHPRNGSDDYSNVLFGAMWLVLQPREQEAPFFGVQRFDGKYWLDGNNNPLPGYARDGSRVPHNVANEQSPPCLIDFSELNRDRRLDGDGFTADQFPRKDN